MAAAEQDPLTRSPRSAPTAGGESSREFFGLVYDELHDLAGLQRGRWQGDETLNTTALVHEAYLRLADTSSSHWRDRDHFLAVASMAMRQVLLDYAKRRGAAKRGGGGRRVSLEEIEATLAGEGDAAEAWSEAVIALDESLRRLERHDARQARIVECRFFAGMSVEETSGALGISPATVKRGWRMGRAWLYRDLEGRLARR